MLKFLAPVYFFCLTLLLFTPFQYSLLKSTPLTSWTKTNFTHQDLENKWKAIKPFFLEGTGENTAQINFYPAVYIRGKRYSLTFLSNLWDDPVFTSTQGQNDEFSFNNLQTRRELYALIAGQVTLKDLRKVKSDMQFLMSGRVLDLKITEFSNKQQQLLLEVKQYWKNEFVPLVQNLRAKPPNLGSNIHFFVDDAQFDFEEDLFEIGYQRYPFRDKLLSEFIEARKYYFYDDLAKWNWNNFSQFFAARLTNQEIQQALLNRQLALSLYQDISQFVLKNQPLQKPTSYRQWIKANNQIYWVDQILSQPGGDWAFNGVNGHKLLSLSTRLQVYALVSDGIDFNQFQQLRQTTTLFPFITKKGPKQHLFNDWIDQINTIFVANPTLLSAKEALQNSQIFNLFTSDLSDFDSFDMRWLINQGLTKRWNQLASQTKDHFFSFFYPRSQLLKQATFTKLLQTVDANSKLWQAFQTFMQKFRFAKKTLVFKEKTYSIGLILQNQEVKNWKQLDTKTLIEIKKLIDDDITANNLATVLKANNQNQSLYSKKSSTELYLPLSLLLLTVGGFLTTLALKKS